jgi:hypothetical protein
MGVAKISFGEEEQPEDLPKTLHLSHLKLSFADHPSVFPYSLNARDQASHPYITTGTIILLYILIFIFVNSRREDKRF